MKDRLGLTSMLAQKDIQAIVLGDLTVQGNIKGINSAMEPLQVAMENGAQRALLPIANKNQVAGLPEEIVERLDIVFYGDPDRAVSKVLEG
jgi:ATP-dependent Lon protease